MTTQQKPIQSGFGFTSTAEEALGNKDLSGKTVIVTGGYAGLGLETTRVLRIGKETTSRRGVVALRS